VSVIRKVERGASGELDLACDHHHFLLFIIIFLFFIIITFFFFIITLDSDPSL